jgi:hypothetical protein
MTAAAARDLNPYDQLDLVDHLRDGGCQLAPRCDIGLELCAPAPGQRVILRATVIGGRAPFRLDPTATLEPMKSRVDRALPNMKRRARDLVKSFGNRPPMPRLESECLEDQQFQRALREFNMVAHASPFRFDRRAYRILLSKCKGSHERHDIRACAHDVAGNFSKIFPTAWSAREASSLLGWRGEAAAALPGCQGGRTKRLHDPQGVRDN